MKIHGKKERERNDDEVKQQKIVVNLNGMDETANPCLHLEKQRKKVRKNRSKNKKQYKIIDTC